MEINGHGITALQARLNEPQTTAALMRLLDRIDTLEASVNRLADMMAQAPAFVAMTGDMVDESYQQAAAQGVDLEGRLQTALGLAEKLTRPEMTAKLERLMEMADTAPGFVAMVGDMADETYRQAAVEGVYIEERVQAGLGLAEKLTRPEMVANLNQLIDMAQTAPSFIAMLGDIADEAYRNAQAQGVDIESLVRKGAGAVSQLEALLDSGVLEPDAVATVGAAGKALALASKEEIRPVGLFQLLGALRDPDTQRALGFLMNVGKHLGQQL